MSTSGLATTQAADEEDVIPLFETLDWLEQQLAERRLLFGEALTEADIRLFTTLIVGAKRPRAYALYRKSFTSLLATQLAAPASAMTSSEAPA